MSSPEQQAVDTANDNLLAGLKSENEFLRKTMADYESRYGKKKQALILLADIFTVILIVGFTTTMLQHAYRYEQLGYYIEKIDACVTNKKIPSVLCGFPQQIQVGIPINDTIWKGLLVNVTKA